MRCEICGKKIMGKPIRVKIEGSVMDVCADCSKFGKVQRQPEKPKRAPRRRTARPMEPVYEVLEDYNRIIREAREKRGWSRENLAKKMNEKVSVIHRIEAGRMEPDIKLAKKFEKTLNIRILEKFEEEETPGARAGSFRGATIGDIARIKKR
ncbi:MAG TPA: TIGR00270 family protein [Methanothermobacter sp.]|jgi:putative transcription factor|uniref:Transcriptional regulator n=1 Tax=Methanothermobacter tenebrarum TaxID=680118 RepID=A0ABN6PES3_9EURY|nr:multiprotein bridging factor aMBF1 [Methanothermobacter tenebrarum]MDD3455074.1 multiprotein bridging factor aMBF1 [Methanobacteriales archaeon]MDI6881625.1 multiprotein bridging factor aMBF1 [Methanothermobacter sp.]MDX9693533.1 multiprotein bridging factor aMBF1 [Methanothermobacter sp.]BDH79404.1 transcriptional regulator [Methanothermobacter tenebrarum]HHW16075.1 TIGR00270 family protein [Methanothermobacter sp.]